MPLQNIRSKTAIYYLFSNNHLNEIVAMRFDFEDDEVSRQPADGCFRLCTATCPALPPTVTSCVVHILAVLVANPGG